VDVGGFAEPRKILSQCALPSYEQISVHPRSAHGGDGIPNNTYINNKNSRGGGGGLTVKEMIVMLMDP